MQLLYFCMLLSAVAMPTLPKFSESVDPIVSLTAVLMLVFAYGLLGLSVETQMNRLINRGKSPRVIVDLYAIWKRLIQWSWVFIAPFVLAAAGWGVMPQELVPRVDSLALSLGIWLLPTLVLIVLLDSQTYRWRRKLYATLERTEAKAEVTSPRFNKTTIRKKLVQKSNWTADWNMLWADARHTWLMVFSLPWLACVAIDSATYGSHFWNFSSSTQYVMGALAMLASVAVVPNAMLWFWSTEPLEGMDDPCSPISKERVQWIKDLWRQHVAHSPRVLYWSTNRRFATAMVVGWLPPLRCLVLSDAIFERLNDKELRMVILHEIAHVHRNHIGWRFVPVFLGTILLANWFQPASYAFLMDRIENYAYWIHGVATLSIIIMLLLSISFTAKWTELDADRFAIELSTMHETKATQPQESQIRPRINAIGSLVGNIVAFRTNNVLAERSALKSHAKELILALEKSVPRSHHDFGGWLHPSVNARRLRIVQQYFKDAYSLVESEDRVSGNVIANCHSTPPSAFEIQEPAAYSPGVV